jgi:hypothetical protein
MRNGNQNAVLADGAVRIRLGWSLPSIMALTFLFVLLDRRFNKSRHQDKLR